MAGRWSSCNIDDSFDNGLCIIYHDGNGWRKSNKILIVVVIVGVEVVLVLVVLIAGVMVKEVIVMLLK